MNTVESDVPQPGADSHSGSGMLVIQNHSQKLKLIQHLINNLAQPLVVSGPEGIGKSTILRHLAYHPQKGWEACLLDATSKTDLETVLRQLLKAAGGSTLSRDISEVTKVLTDKLQEFSADNRLLVLLLDDAGRLVPGLLKRILDFAAEQPVLRLVFAMRPENLHVKTSTDAGVDNCHFIDIPPLNEQETEEYLRMLDSDSLGIPADAITTSLVARVFRESHGIPGNINNYLLKTVQAGVPGKRNLLLPGSIAAAVLIAMATGYLLWKPEMNDAIHRRVENDAPVGALQDLDDRVPRATRPTTRPSVPSETVNSANKDEGLPDNPLFDSKARPLQVDDNALLVRRVSEEIDAEKVSIINILAATQNKEGEASAPAEKKTIAPLAKSKVDAVPLDSKGRRQLDIKPVKKLTPTRVVVSDSGGDNIKAPVAQTRQPQRKAPRAGLNNPAWLLDQNAQHYTLQLMASPEVVDLHDFVEKFPKLSEFAYYRVRKGKTDWYRLLYGNYSSLVAAKKATSKLPTSFRKAWPRSMKIVQKEIRAVQD